MPRASDSLCPRCLGRRWRHICRCLHGLTKANEHPLQNAGRRQASDLRRQCQVCSGASNAKFVVVQGGRGAGFGGGAPGGAWRLELQKAAPTSGEQVVEMHI
eukprot:1145895-Pelagomonas_calceolata.AAC.4